MIISLPKFLLLEFAVQLPGEVPEEEWLKGNQLWQPSCRKWEEKKKRENCGNQIAEKSGRNLIVILGNKVAENEGTNLIVI